MPQPTAKDPVVYQLEALEPPTAGPPLGVITVASVKTLEDELEALTPAHRAQAEAALALRARAAQLAQELGYDAGDVFHQLQRLARSPTERLRLGLAHGRLRARVAD